MKKLKILLKLTGVLILLGSLSLYFYLNSFLAKRSGEMKLEGLTEHVSVYYDKYAIPHIEAQSEEDAFYAFGYIHAQDRLFQMEMLRRLAKGELSSFLGKDLVPIDTFFRTLGIKTTAKKIVDRMDFSKPQFRALKSYLRGINKFMKEDKTIEYKILGISKEPFTPVDTIAISGYMSFSFAQGFRVSPVLHAIKSKLPRAYYEDFVQDLNQDTGSFYQQKSLSTLSPHETIKEHINEKILDPLTNFLPGVPVFFGSNAWVVSGKRTKSGLPILANDPHIGYAVPSVWYETHMKAPGFELYGHYIAGIPFAPIGHTPDKAWGMTMFQNDDMLFYKEQVNPENPKEVFHRGKWIPLKERKEVIQVKGEDPVTITIAKTPRGPVINHLVESYKDLKEPISLWWSFQSTENDMVSTFYKLAHKTNFKEIPKILETVKAPSLNFLYADTEGNIAWWPLAKIPILKKQVPTKEFLDPSNPDHQISDYIPFNDKPHLVNPDDGIIVSANSDPLHITKTKHYIPGYFCHKQRLLRIKELLSQKNNWTIEEMKKVQLDDLDKVKNVLIQKLSQSLEENLDPVSKEAWGILKNWSGTHSKKEIGPTIYYTFLSHTVSFLLEEKLSPKMFKDFYNTHHLYAFLENIFEKENSIWWHGDKKNQTQASILREIWKKTLYTLSDFSGKDPKKWIWEKAHTLEQVHAIGRKKPFDLIFNIGPYGIAGGYEVANNQKFDLSHKLPFKVRAGPSTRRLVDMKNPKSSLGINPTGQSGYFWDKHYKDQSKLHREGKYRKQLMDLEKIKKEQSTKLILNP